MRIRWLLLVCLVFAMFAISACKSDALPGLDSAEELTLYSIDGRYFEPDEVPKTEEKLYSYPVLGKIEVKDAETRKLIISAIKNSINEKGNQAKCFWPRHAVRVYAKNIIADYVICFECGNYEIVTEGKRSGTTYPISRSAQPLLDNQLTEAGIPLAPGPKRVQAEK